MKREVPLSLPDVGEREKEAVLSVLKSRWLSMGPVILDFEKKIADYIGVKYAVAVNSGTSGLHLIVRGLGLGEGDEVITTPFSFISSANCLLFERVRPVFADIDPQTLNIDVSQIKQKITSKTKAILPVHVFGHPADMTDILDIALKSGLNIIEDACEAIGARYNGKLAGSESDAAVFAFYPNKQITTGEGGVIVTNRKDLAGICRSMRNQGREAGAGWYEHSRLGYNYRMDEMSAALGCAQLARLSDILIKRETVAQRYTEKLRRLDGVSVPFVGPDVQVSWFVYVVRLDPEIDRDTVMRELTGRGIGCRAYFQPIHLQPFYRKAFGYKPGDFPVTEAAAVSTLALPFHNNLSEDEIDYVVTNLKEVLSKF
ncbi:DegT/DnrJ/EryC1/StrS family aminotransferase [Desulfoscipio geothermicus]|uniref:Perosamine synthetase n=1 Tax=Desulfoscipio geothermicus DSM 3669 TaxID=1121426 RepID=A0A1I6EJV8_9FIRM|nr:DegT/DnrJ/EryC1/StrS family aminotransferase [Desulfoscipio geothermicus]SFR18056.1 perosamine synthetase [Desulfoscipio geothermicus DSM 3669]